MTKYVAAPTENDILEARAAVCITRATLTEAEYLYATLTGGEVPDDTTGSGLSELQQARLDLNAAQADLDGTRIYAPFSGKVMSIDVRVGDTVGSSTASSPCPISASHIWRSTWTNRIG